MSQLLVPWQLEHWPGQWPSGGAWQERQSVKTLWLTLTSDQLVMLWQLEHCPYQWSAGAGWQEAQSLPR